MSSVSVNSRNGRTKVKINGAKYTFTIVGNVDAIGKSVIINGISVIKDGVLTEEGRRYLK